MWIRGVRGRLLCLGDGVGGEEGSGGGGWLEIEKEVERVSWRKRDG